MYVASRGTRAITRAAIVCLVLFLLLAVVPSALAADQPSGAVTLSPSNPTTSDTIVASVESRECPTPPAGTRTYTFTYSVHNADGTQTPVNTSGPLSGPSYSTTIPQAGDYTVDERTHCSTPSDDDTYTSDVTVRGPLGGSISVSPDPPIAGQSATLSAAATGGYPGYAFSWDLNNDGTFGDATGRVVPDTFTAAGPQTVAVQITDDRDANGNALPGNPTHTITVTRTIDVTPTTSTTSTTSTISTAPTAPTTSTPTAVPPPSCLQTVIVALSEFKTPGCFTLVSSAPNQWTTTSSVTLNGILLPDYGQTFTITDATPSEPGGHFTAPNSTMQLGGFTAFSGDINWSLPAAGPVDAQGNDEEVVPGRSFSVATGATLLGLKVRGSIALELGRTADGSYFADFPLSVELPAAFSAGPEPSFGTVTGSATLRVDDAGVHYGGLKLEASDVWLGKLKVHSVCFSYIPAGGVSTTPCQAPSFGGDPGLIAAPGSDAPFIDCPDDPSTNRWNASAEIEVPSGLQLGAFGGLQGTQVSELGGSINNLGRRVPLAYGLYLDHIAFGLCLTPQPFKIRANVGADFLGASNLVNIDGGFTYTDANGYDPWSLELDGSVSLGEEPNALTLGQGTLGINGSGVIDFGLQAGVTVAGGVASLSAKVDGWIDAPNRQFVVSGDGKGCLGSVCAEAEGELSSTGIAGCVTIGSSTPTYDLIIPLDGGPVHLDDTSYPLTGGFGYRWGAGSAQLLGGSCDFSSYEPAGFVSDLATAASAGLHLQVAQGTQAVALRIHGTMGPPKIVLHGPGGAIIASPSHATATLHKGHYLLVENKSDATTDVMLIHPAAGDWTIEGARGSVSSPTKLDRASLETPPTLGARVLGTGAVRTVQVAYAVPVGASVALRERSKGVNQTLAAHLGGHRCPGLPALRPHTNEKILCADVRFRPAPGVSAARTVQATVIRNGIPLLQRSIASFRAPRLTLPSRVGALRVKRSKQSLVVAFSPSSGAAQYAVSAKLSDGRDLSFDLKSGCRALRIPDVPTGVAAAIKIAGVRFDLAVGPMRAVAISATARSAGAKSKQRRLGKLCS